MTQLDIVCDLNRRLRERCESAEAAIEAREGAKPAEVPTVNMGELLLKHELNMAREEVRSFSDAYGEARKYAWRWKALAKRLRMDLDAYTLRWGAKPFRGTADEWEARDHWKARAEAAEKERDALKAKLAEGWMKSDADDRWITYKIKAEAAEKRADESEAACAVMRKLLNKMTPTGWSLDIKDALAPDAGRRLMERVNELERLVRLADAYFVTSFCARANGKPSCLCDTCRELGDAFDREAAKQEGM